MLSMDRIAQLSKKALIVAEEVAFDAAQNIHDLDRLEYDQQQLLVVKKIGKMLSTIINYRIQNGMYEED